MMGLGTVINAIAIIFGGILGMLFGKYIKDEFQNTMIMACGVSTLFIGMSGALVEMLSVSEDGSLSSQGTMMAIICMVLGGVVGELLRLEDHLEAFGNWLKVKTKSEKDNSFVDAFVTASLTVCIGAMAIVGAIQDGLMHDYSILIAKSILDLIIIIVFTASLGKGAMFSAIPVFVLQGSVTILSRLIEPIMTKEALSNLSLTGSILIFCVGINLVWGKKIKVANLLPTIIFAVIWSFLPIVI